MRRLQRHWIRTGDSASPTGSKDISAILQGEWRKRACCQSGGETEGAPARLAVFFQVDHVRLAPESGSKADMRARRNGPVDETARTVERRGWRHGEAIGDSSS
jgi:hypothetical protein